MIEQGAFRIMQTLEKLIMCDQETFERDDIVGCSSIKEIDLRSLKVIQASTFEGLESLEALNINNAFTVHSSAFKNCVSIVEISIPRVIELVGD